MPGLEAVAVRVALEAGVLAALVHELSEERLAVRLGHGPELGEDIVRLAELALALALGECRAAVVGGAQEDVLRRYEAVFLREGEASSSETFSPVEP